MRYAIPALAAATLVALAGCDRPAPSTASTTVVKEPVVQREKETVVQPAPSAPSSSTTIVQAPEQPQAPASTPSTIEKSKSTTTERVDTPMGTVTKTETERSRTTQ